MPNASHLNEAPVETEWARCDGIDVADPQLGAGDGADCNVFRTVAT